MANYSWMTMVPEELVECTECGEAVAGLVKHQ